MPPARPRLPAGSPDHSEAMQVARPAADAPPPGALDILSLDVWQNCAFARLLGYREVCALACCSKALHQLMSNEHIWRELFLAAKRMPALTTVAHWRETFKSRTLLGAQWRVETMVRSKATWKWFVSRCMKTNASAIALRRHATIRVCPATVAEARKERAKEWARIAAVSSAAPDAWSDSGADGGSGAKAAQGAAPSSEHGLAPSHAAGKRGLSPAAGVGGAACAGAAATAAGTSGTGVGGADAVPVSAPAAESGGSAESLASLERGSGVGGGRGAGDGIGGAVSDRGNARRTVSPAASAAHLDAVSASAGAGPSTPGITPSAHEAGALAGWDSTSSSGPAVAGGVAACDANVVSEAADLEAAATAIPYVVDRSGLRVYATISEAIAAAAPLDRIVVEPGEYHENLAIDKPLEIVGVESGYPAVIRGDCSAATVWLTASCRLSHLTLAQDAATSESPILATVLASGGLHVLIDECDITSAAGHAVVVKGPRTKATVTHNLIRGSRGVGVLFCDDATGVLRDNTVCGNKRAGIAILRGGAPHVCGNLIRDGEDSGVLVSETGKGRVEGNLIRGNTRAGVAILQGGQPHVVRNTIANGKDSGVLVCECGEGVIEHNIIASNRIAGIAVCSGAAPTVLHNRIARGDGRALCIADGCHPVVESNTLEASQDLSDLSVPAHMRSLLPSKNALVDAVEVPSPIPRANTEGSALTGEVLAPIGVPAGPGGASAQDGSHRPGHHSPASYIARALPLPHGFSLKVGHIGHRRPTA